jgi:Fic family protein
MWKPNFTITPKISKALIKIELLKESIKKLPITPKLMKTLRDTARLQSVHYSTRIEGNRLSQKEVAQVIDGKGTGLTGRKRDEREIKGYYAALTFLEQNVSKPITETAVKTIHALVEGGGKIKIKPTPYRDGQNVITDSGTNNIVYMPPESKDVPALMADLIDWIKTEKNDLPIPIVAAMAHYQFATIHPYYDGNGRTARLLTTLVLYQSGYDLKGLYSLEEYYANDLQSYYDAISRGPHHNYYFGHETADITPWLEYFILGMLDSFTKVKRRAEELAGTGSNDKSAMLRELNPKQRKILMLFQGQKYITSKDIENLFGFSIRAARFLLKNMMESGFIRIANPADKTRTYKLGEEYEYLID